MAYYLPDKFVFLAHPRCASRAIGNAIKSMGGLRVGNHHGPLGRPFTEPSFCVIRHPLDLLVSFYCLPRVGKGEEFDTWLKEYSHPNLEKDGRLFYYSEVADTIIPYCDLKRRLFKEFGIMLIKEIGVSENKPSTTPSSEEIARDRWPLDFKFWDEFSKS